MIRTAPQGLEVFCPMRNPEEPNKAVMTIDYYSVEVRVGRLTNTHPNNFAAWRHCAVN